jgi:hypothetical protein
VSIRDNGRRATLTTKCIKGEIAMSDQNYTKLLQADEDELYQQIGEEFYPQIGKVGACLNDGQDLKVSGSDSYIANFGKVGAYLNDGQDLKVAVRDSSIANFGSEFGSPVYNQALAVASDIVDYGKKYFDTWALEAFQLICGSNPQDSADRDALMQAMDLNDVEVVSALVIYLQTTAIVASIPPALVAIFATILFRRFIKPLIQQDHKEFCGYWKNTLPQNTLMG